MTRELTPNQVKQLRRDAKREGRVHGISHARALDRVAGRHGFANWSLLMRHVAQEQQSTHEPTVQPTLPIATPAWEATGLPRMDATREELQLIAAIVERFEVLIGDDYPVNRLSLMMDLEACHSNGCPLDLVALLEAARGEDLVHDVAGISTHLDRASGKLQGYFQPRYARP